MCFIPPSHIRKIAAVMKGLPAASAAGVGNPLFSGVALKNKTCLGGYLRLRPQYAEIPYNRCKYIISFLKEPGDINGFKKPPAQIPPARSPAYGLSVYQEMIAVVCRDVHNEGLRDLREMYFFAKIEDTKIARGTFRAVNP